jgi:hypothetical protein
MSVQEATVITKIDRSPKGLVEALFNSLDGLNAGVKSADDVRATAHTARSIVSIARLEMDAVRLAENLGKRVDFASLPGLGARAQIEIK